MRFWLGVLGFSLALALGSCGEDAPAPSAPDGGAGSGGGDAGDAGDAQRTPTLTAICVKSLVAAAPAGEAACPAPLPASPDALDEALAEAGIDRCGYGLSDATMSIWKPIFADDAYQLSAFRPLHAGPLRLPAFASESESWLVQAVAGETPLSSALLASAVRAGIELDTCFDPSAFATAAASEAPLAQALALLAEHHGGSGDYASASAGVPIALQRALVPVIAAIDHAASELGAALATTDPETLDWLSRVHAFVLPATQAFALDDAHLASLEAVDRARITRAAAIVLRAVENAELETFAGEALPDVAVDTPIGAVVLGGPDKHVYGEGQLAERSALLIDTGGDDEYRVAVGSGRLGVPIGVAIDLGGSDRYGYVEQPHAQDLASRLPSDSAGRSSSLGSFGQTLSRAGRQGSGVAGIGALYDLGSEGDEYRSLALSQGAGALGVGALFDAGGDDSYAAEALSQGAALWGVGLLVDRAGKDEYRTFHAAQGFGYVRGVGVLADGDGADVYFADPGDPAIGGDPLYPSAQLPSEGNTSFAQGAGFGRRDDTTGYDMGGGLGMLWDGAGDDRYTASVFAQAAGYWLGFGMLVDGAGNDTYEGLWYVQGASAHFALALHLDRDGDDTYNESFPVRATSIGVGHDFSAALHIDLGGADRYFAPGLSLGCGNSQGVGGLINVGGNDHYAPAGAQTFGCASIGHGAPFDTTRDVRPTLGVFVDAIGVDTFLVPSGGPAALDEASWSHPIFKGGAGVPDSEASGGVDRGAGTVGLP